MSNIIKRKRSIIIVLALLFFLGRIVGLHAHGHLDVENHEHDEISAMSHHHEHSDEKIHIANSFSDNHDFAVDHDDHGESFFDIENEVLVKKQTQKNSSVKILFVIFIALFVGLFVTLICSLKPQEQVEQKLNKFLFRNHPLRAPPYFV